MPFRHLYNHGAVHGAHCSKRKKATARDGFDACRGEAPKACRAASLPLAVYFLRVFSPRAQHNCRNYMLRRQAVLSRLVECHAARRLLEAVESASAQLVGQACLLSVPQQWNEQKFSSFMVFLVSALVLRCWCLFHAGPSKFGRSWAYSARFPLYISQTSGQEAEGQPDRQCHILAILLLCWPTLVRPAVQHAIR